MKTVRTTKAVAEQYDPNKFGENVAAATGDLLGALGEPVNLPLAAAATMYISSSHAADTGILITVEYIDGDGAEQVVTKALDGSDSKTFVDLAILGTFVNRAYVNDADITLAGNVYVSSSNTDAGGDGIPDLLTTVFAYIPLGDQQTMQCAYLVPSERYGRSVARALMSGWAVDLIKNATANGKAKLKQIPTGGSIRTVEAKGLAQGGPADRDFPKVRPFAVGTLLYIEVTDVSVAVNLTGYMDIDLQMI